MAVYELRGRRQVIVLTARAHLASRPQRTFRGVELLLVADGLKQLIHAELQNTVLASKAIAGIEAGKLEIRSGLRNVLKAMSRIAPQFMLNQMEYGDTQEVTGP